MEKEKFTFEELKQEVWNYHFDDFDISTDTKEFFKEIQTYDELCDFLMENGFDECEVHISIINSIVNLNMITLTLDIKSGQIK